MPSPEELTTHSALGLSELLRARHVSAEEVVEAHLRRIDRLNPSLNAFCTVIHEQALAAAKAADAAVARGAAPGPLHGLPVALKDLTPTRGVRTTRGSRLFADHVPDEDAVLVQRIKAAGGIVVGKTNTPEFGHKGVTDNQVFGVTRNPWAPDRVPGGSSGGSAAALAAGLVPLAEGSDGAGSIRIPASLCGVFGLKPTYGRVPDVMGAFSSHTPFFHNGALARSVGDAELLYRVMAGPHPSDPFSLPPADPAPDGGIKGLRVAYSPDLGRFPVAPDVARVCREAAEAFGAQGCAVEALEIAWDDDVEHLFKTLWRARLASAYSELPREKLALLEPAVQQLIDEGTRLRAADLGWATLARERVLKRLSAVFKDHDLLLSPTTAVPAFPIDGGAPERINGQPADPLIGWFLTYPINLTGNPAASIPCGCCGEGLPVGLQIIGPRLEDERVLRAARAFEAMHPWDRIAPG